MGVVEVLSERVSEQASFVGQTEAVQRVELRVRVQGTIDRKFFVDGDRVDEGQKLFQIDPRSPMAALAQSKANLASSRAGSQKAKADARRARELYAVNAISKAELDTALASERASRAEVNAMSAAVKTAALDTQYTSITAPFAGRIGQTTVDVGNFVQPSTEKPLATLTRLDPIYVSFALDERQYLRAQARTGGKLDMVALELADGTIYEYQGKVVFLSPEMDRSTGTFILRALFPNPHEILKPGLFAKLILRRGGKAKALLVPQDAVVIRQSGMYAYVVNDKNEVEERRIATGPTRGVLQVIEKGLEPGEKVVAVGVHKVRDGLVVKPRALEKISLKSDPLRAAPPKVMEGDWMAGFTPERFASDTATAAESKK